MGSQHPKISKPPTAGEAERIIRRDIEIMARSYRKLFPLVVKSVEGSIVEDINGNRYIDFTANSGTLLLGGRHPLILQALKEQVERFASYSLTTVYCEEAVELAEELSKIAPIRGDVRIIFTNSESEAVDAAVRALNWHTGKNVILSFLGAKHGSTMKGLQLSSDSRERRQAVKIENVLYAPSPRCSRCMLGLSFEKCEFKCLDYSRRIAEALAPDELSIILFEPIQVEAGVVIPPEGYLERLTHSAKSMGALSVADESYTAPARTGRWFTLDYWNVKVDAVCLGAQLSSGLPLGALIAREDLLDLEPGMYESLTGGCQISISAALATLRAVKEEGLIERSERIGRSIMKRIRDILEELELSWEVRGLGMLIGIEIVDESGSPMEKLARELVEECFRIGLLIRRRRESIILSPALNIEEEILERGLEILETKISELSRLSQVF